MRPEAIGDFRSEDWSGCVWFETLFQSVSSRLLGEGRSGGVSESVNSGLTSHKERAHMDRGPRFKVSAGRPEKRGIDLAVGVGVHV